VAEETRKLIVTQPEETAFALSGSDRDPPMRHRIAGDVNHRTEKPIVHMHLWDEDCSCKLEGDVVLRGNPDAPVVLQHDFPEEHRQSHIMKTGLADPIHHALQMRTPLQVRFCNSWHVASDYAIGVQLRGREWLGIRLTGATVATPQPCPEDEYRPDRAADYK
jgi:hypothetical protein